MKRKAFPILLCFLICLSLVGVGFAGWVITGSDEKTLEDGQIKVEAVTDNRYAITDGTWVGTNTFNFIGTADESVSNPWLTYQTSDSENLSVTYKFKVTKGGNVYTEATDISAKVTLDANLATEIAKASGKMITLGSGFTLNEDNKTVNLTVNKVDGEDGFYTITFTLAWGDKFGGKNPYTYYNTLVSVTNTTKTDAFNALKALHDLNGQKVTITITAK